MTNILINDQAQMVRITGHAEFDKEGKDIVCAGVSTLAWTLAGALTKIEALTYVEDTGGDMLICYKALPQALVYVDMFCTGAEMLAYRYPDNVSYQGRKKELKNDTMNEKGGVVCH